MPSGICIALHARTHTPHAHAHTTQPPKHQQPTARQLRPPSHLLLDVLQPAVLPAPRLSQPAALRLEGALAQCPAHAKTRYWVAVAGGWLHGHPFIGCKGEFRSRALVPHAAVVLHHVHRLPHRGGGVSDLLCAGSSSCPGTTPVAGLQTARKGWVGAVLPASRLIWGPEPMFS